jgi:hypothetical protein
VRHKPTPKLCVSIAQHASGTAVEICSEVSVFLEHLLAKSHVGTEGRLSCVTFIFTEIEQREHTTQIERALES